VCALSNLFNPFGGSHTMSGKPISLYYDFDTDSAHLIIQVSGGKQYRFRGYGGIAQSLLRQIKPGVGVIVVQYTANDPTTIQTFWFA
jgi:hypothetical protein